MHMAWHMIYVGPRCVVESRGTRRVESRSGPTFVSRQEELPQHLTRAAAGPDMGAVELRVLGEVERGPFMTGGLSRPSPPNLGRCEHVVMGNSRVRGVG
jgi:hypothetical protein